MKRFAPLFGLVLLSLALPVTASAASASLVSGRPDFARPSARSIKAQVRTAGAVRNAQMLSTQDVSLDATFSNATYGVKMQYPSKWQRQDLMEKNPPLTLVTMFLSPREGNSDLRQNVNLVVEEMDMQMSLEEYSKQGIATEAAYFDQYSIMKSEPIKVSGMYPGYRVIFTATLKSGAQMTFEQVWVLRGNLAHVWTFADGKDTFEKHVGVFERMMNTLTLSK